MIEEARFELIEEEARFKIYIPNQNFYFDWVYILIMKQYG